MGYLDEKEVKEPYDFLECNQGKELFAVLDYALKDGVHIQNFGKQKELFLYLCRYYPTLKLYYNEFWGVELEEGGTESGKYFYIRFNPDKKNRIPKSHKHVMPKEHIIVGILLYKVYFIDCNLELNSLKRFQKIIRIDYPDLKPGIVRVLAKSKREKATKLNDDKVDTIIRSAFDEFRKMNWISMEDEDTFEILPSFHRLTKEFASIINGIDDILKDS